MSLEQKLEELNKEIFLHFRNNEDGSSGHLQYQQVITIDEDCHQELSVEIKPYRKQISVPNIIRSYLRKNDLTISDFANNIKIGRPALSNYINGKSALSFSLAEKLAKPLFISVETLLKIDLEQKYSLYKNKK